IPVEGGGNIDVRHKNSARIPGDVGGFVVFFQLPSDEKLKGKVKKSLSKGQSVILGHASITIRIADKDETAEKDITLRRSDRLKAKREQEAHSETTAPGTYGGYPAPDIYITYPEDRQVNVGQGSGVFYVRGIIDPLVPNRSAQCGCSLSGG